MNLRTAVLSLAVLPLVAHADPSADLEVARRQANAHFQAADGRVKEAGAALNSATAAFRGCKNGALQFQFTGALARLESSRRGLEQGRRAAQAFRHSLEAVRARLEAEHARRNAPTRPEALANEQVYVERLAQEYVKPLDTTLVPLVEEYVAGVTAYTQALTQYAAFCARPGYTATAGAAFVGSLEESLDALAGTSDHLLATATEANRALAGRALSVK